VNNRIYNFPFTIILYANLFTIFLFLIAPFDYSIGSPIIVVFYIILNFLFIYFGYKLGVQRGLSKKSKTYNYFFKYSQIHAVFMFGFYTLTFLIKYAYLLRFSIFDIQGMFNHLLIGFVDPQLGYYMSVYDFRPHTVSWLIYTLISIPNQIFFIYGFLVWNKISNFLKILFCVFLAIEIFYWFGRGTGFGIIAIISNIITVFIINSKVKKLNFRLVLAFFFLLFLSLSVFGFIKTKRAGGDIDNLQVFNTVGSSVIEDHIVFAFIPEFFVQTYMHSTVYLTQGYFHLGIALNSDIPFTSTFMFGNNPATLNVAKILGVDLWERTYMSKLYVLKGIDDVAKWHSAYLWYANDVSFFGVPIILFFFSFFLGCSYVHILNFDDLLSKIYFVIIFNCFLFLFANNTYLYQLFYSFVVISVVWIFSRIFNFRTSG
jgi:hypothetical protein